VAIPAINLVVVLTNLLVVVAQVVTQQVVGALPLAVLITAKSI
jgi:hypothetical protein